MSENHKERSNYQQGMDAIHLSEEKAGETLRMMLEKNQKLNRQEAEKRQRNSIWRYLPVLAAAAACLALALFIWPKGGSSAPFGSIRMNQLPMSSQSRSDDAVSASFNRVFGFDTKELLPGWVTTPVEISTGTMKNGTVYEARWLYEKDGKQLHVSATTYEPALYTALSGTEPWKNDSRLNRDPDTGILYAVFRLQEQYLVVWAEDMNEKEFLSAIEQFVFLPSDNLLQESRPWTVMVYMVDSGDAVLLDRDLNEMRGALRPDTQLLVLIGGTSQKECRLYQFQPENETLLDSWVGSMGQEDTLERLLRAGAQISDGNTALVFWDHGYGPVEGFGGTGNSPTEERLSLMETANALKACGLDQHPLTVIGYDSCMMAGCETAVILRPYAKYLIASQETEPSDGWNYGFLKDICPESSGEEFGRLVVDSYAAFFEALYEQYSDYWQPYTLSLVDLGSVQSLSDSIDEYFSALEENLQAGGFSDISRLRMDVWGFGRGTTSTEYDVIDLFELAKAGEAVYPEAVRILDALDQCVVYCGGNQQRAHGLSIFFPLLATVGNLDAWRNQITALPLRETWQRFLINYCEALTADRSFPSIEMISFEEDAVRFILGDDALRDFAYAKYYLLEGTMEEGMFLLYSTQSYLLEDYTLTVPYARKVLQMNNGSYSCPIPSFIGQEDDSHVYCRSYALAALNSFTTESVIGTRVPVYLRSIQDKETGEWEIMTAFSSGDELVTGRQEILLTDIDDLILSFYPYTPAYDAAGRLLPWHLWNDPGYGYYDSIYVKDGVTLEEIPLPEYGGPDWLQVVIVDTHNHQYSAALLPLN